MEDTPLPPASTDVRLPHNPHLSSSNPQLTTTFPSQTAPRPRSPRIQPLRPLPHLHLQHRLDPRPRSPRAHPIPPTHATQTGLNLHHLDGGLRTTRHLPMRDRARHGSGQRGVGATEAQHGVAMGRVELVDETEDVEFDGGGSE